jgi:mannose-6-phosphate isomerase-like protein (cupin superfamily)
MNTARLHFLMAMFAACSSLGTMALAQTPAPTKPLLGSGVFDWSKLEAKPTKIGARRDVFDATTATLGALECHITTVNPGESPHAAHRHPDEELLIIKEGTVEVTINGVTWQAGPGSLVFFASNNPHGLRNNGTIPATYYVLRFAPHDLAHAPAASGSVPPRSP